MTFKTKTISSLFFAFCITVIDIGHKKIGGLLSGGNYSDSHSWSEMTDFIPEFIGMFIIVFVFALLYFIIFKNEKFYICSKCQKTYMNNQQTPPLCDVCNIFTEELDGFYDRHPNLKKDDSKLNT